MEKKPWYQSWTLWSAKAVAVLAVLPEAISWVDANLGLHLAVNPIVVKVLTVAAALVIAYRKFFGDNKAAAVSTK